MKVQGLVDTIDGWNIVVINCYEIFLIVFLRNLLVFWGFFLLSSGVFKENTIDGCERTAGRSYEMEINHLNQSEEAPCLLDSGNISRGT